MLARAVLILTLATLLVACASAWYLLGEPRRPRADAESTVAAGRLPTARSQHTFPERAIRLEPPSQVLSRLPATALVDEPPVLAAGEPAQPDSRAVEASDDSPSGGGQGVEPRILEASPTAIPLPRATLPIAPNRPAALVKTQAASASGSADQPHGAESELMRLMRALHDPREAQTAERELAQRGFAANHIELARRFTSPEVQVRCDAVRSVTSVRGLVPADWLDWASRDSARDVRLTAVALMITSGQDQLLRRVEQIASDDPDLEVRALARSRLDQMRQRR